MFENFNEMKNFTEKYYARRGETLFQNIMKQEEKPEYSYNH